MKPKQLKKISNRTVLDDLLKTDAGKESLKQALDPYIPDFGKIGEVVEKVRASRNPWCWMVLGDYLTQESRKLSALLESATMDIRQSRTIQIQDPDRPAWMKEVGNDNT